MISQYFTEFYKDLLQDMEKKMRLDVKLKPIPHNEPLSDYLLAINNPEHTRFMETHNNWGRKALRQDIEQSNRIGIYRERQLIGTIGKKNQTIGIMIFKPYCGQGYGKQAITCAQETLGEDTLFAGVVFANTPSLRLFLSCGFIPVAADHSYICKGNVGRLILKWQRN